MTAPCMTLRNPVKRVLARCVMARGTSQERFLWIDDARANGAFNEQDAAVMRKLCEVLG